jgi:hypothetical protein
MFGTRRAFLRGFVGGLAGLAGLLSPGRVWAWGRRRRGGGCATPPVVVEPAFIPVPEAIGPPPVGTGSPAISINYPPSGTTSSPTIVPGGGGFCAWGTMSNIVPGSLAAQALVGGSPVGSAVLVTSGPVLPCQWAFAVTGVGAAGTNFSFRVTGMPTAGGGPFTTTNTNLRTGLTTFVRKEEPGTKEE